MKFVPGIAKVEILTPTHGWRPVGFVWADASGQERWALDVEANLTDPTGEQAARHRYLSPPLPVPGGDDPERAFRDMCTAQLPSANLAFHKKVRLASGREVL